MTLPWYFADAIMSGDQVYRYMLERRWDDAVQGLSIVMLNPSTADSSVDDPTIQSCMRIAKANGWGGIRVYNLYAFRTAYPYLLAQNDYPEGPNNDRYIEEMLQFAREENRTVMVAWGKNAQANRVDKFLKQAAGVDLLCWNQNKDGSPRHPLYAPGIAPLIPFNRDVV